MEPSRSPSVHGPSPPMSPQPASHGPASDGPASDGPASDGAAGPADPGAAWGGPPGPGVEALAAVLGGRRGPELASRLLDELGPAGLLGPGAEAVLLGCGASSPQRRRFGLAASLARVLLGPSHGGLEPGEVLTPAKAALRLQREAAGLEVEAFWALLLDGRHRLRLVRRVSLGTLTASLVHPREVFRDAIRCGAGAVAVGHNHPSGDPEPSPEDWAVTRRLHRVGELVGIPVVDHLIVTGRAWVSLRARPGWPRGPAPGQHPPGRRPCSCEGSGG